MRLLKLRMIKNVCEQWKILQSYVLLFKDSGKKWFSLVVSWETELFGSTKWRSLSRVQLFVTPWTIQSMEFSRPEYWSGWPFPSPGDLPNPGIKPRSPSLQADSLPAEPQGRLKAPKSFTKSKGCNMQWNNSIYLHVTTCQVFYLCWWCIATVAMISMELICYLLLFHWLFYSWTLDAFKGDSQCYRFFSRT